MENTQLPRTIKRKISPALLYGSNKKIKKFDFLKKKYTRNDRIFSYYLPSGKYAGEYEEMFLDLKRKVYFETEFISRGDNNIEFFIIFKKFHKNNITVFDFLKKENITPKIY